MPNGGDKNWVRVCAAIDGFRIRFGRWPKRVRVMPISYADLVGHVLTPVGFALVSSFVQLVSEDDAAMIAEDGTGAEFNYGVGEPLRIEKPGRAAQWPLKVMDVPSN